MLESTVYRPGFPTTVQDQEGSSYGRDGMRKGEVVSVNVLSGMNQNFKNIFKIFKNFDSWPDHLTGVLMVTVSLQARTLVGVTD